MTVREVMDAINARAKSTVTRLIESGVLEAEELPGHGWLVSRTSVSRFLTPGGRPAGVGAPFSGLTACLPASPPFFM